MINREEIKKALEAATPGEWYLSDEVEVAFSDDELECDLYVMRHVPEAPGRSESVLGFHPEIHCTKEDAHLIANAPTWIKQLLESEAALLEVLKSCEEAIAINLSHPGYKYETPLMDAYNKIKDYREKYQE